MSQAAKAIVEILKSLPDERPVSIPPEYRVIRRHIAIDNGGDPDAIEAWVRKVGGDVVRLPEPIPSGKAIWRSKENEIAYMVPQGALVVPE